MDAVKVLIYSALFLCCTSQALPSCTCNDSHSFCSTTGDLQVTAFVHGVPGLNGSKGEPGQNGRAGDPGPKGEPGMPGPKGIPAEHGSKGAGRVSKESLVISPIFRVNLPSVTYSALAGDGLSTYT